AWARARPLRAPLLPPLRRRPPGGLLLLDPPARLLRELALPLPVGQEVPPIAFLRHIPLLLRQPGVPDGGRRRGRGRPGRPIPGHVVVRDDAAAVPVPDEILLGLGLHGAPRYQGQCGRHGERPPGRESMAIAGFHERPPERNARFGTWSRPTGRGRRSRGEDPRAARRSQPSAPSL